MGQVPAHPLDLVGVDVGGGALDGGGQVEDDLALALGLPHPHDGLADLQGVVALGVDEDLRGVLEAEDRVLVQDLLGPGHDRPGAVDGELADVGAVHAEDDPAEQGRQGVVEVDGGAGQPHAGVQGAVDEVGARLGEHGDGDVVGDGVVVDQGPHEVVVGLGGGGEADLDLLEAHPHQQVEHGALGRWAHGLDEALVAVAQVGAQPAGGGGDAPAGPGAVGQVGDDGVEEGGVLGEGHAGGLLGGGTCGAHGFFLWGCGRSGPTAHRGGAAPGPGGRQDGSAAVGVPARQAPPRRLSRRLVRTRAVARTRARLPHGRPRAQVPTPSLAETGGNDTRNRRKVHILWMTLGAAGPTHIDELLH